MRTSSRRLAIAISVSFARRVTLRWRHVLDQRTPSFTPSLQTTSLRRSPACGDSERIAWHRRIATSLCPPPPYIVYPPPLPSPIFIQSVEAQTLTSFSSFLLKCTQATSNHNYVQGRMIYQLYWCESLILFICLQVLYNYCIVLSVIQFNELEQWSSTFTGHDPQNNHILTGGPPHPDEH